MKESIKVCIVCGNKFENNRKGNHKTCSKDCSNKNRLRLKSNEYKKQNTDFENKKNHDAEYYKNNVEKIRENEKKDIKIYQKIKNKEENNL